MATWAWVALIASAVGSAISGGAAAQATPEPRTDTVTLSFSRHYGRSVFSVCRLDLVVSESRGFASLWCDSTATDSRGRAVPDLSAHLELTSDETNHLTAAVRRARLFDGGHIGADRQAADGVFDTLKVVNDGQAVVLVTSGNKTFDNGSPRNQLLSLLMQIEKRLRQQAGQ